MPPLDHGWFGNGLQLEALFADRSIKVVVEVGSWVGASAIFMARLLPPGGKLFAVDHWRGSSEHQLGEDYHHFAVHRLYHHFLSNVIHAGLTDVIVPVRMESGEAARALNVEPDLIYIDGAHDYESVRSDLYNWYPHAGPETIVCGDDWGRPEVERAVTEFAAEKGLEIHSFCAFWSTELRP